MLFLLFFSGTVWETVFHRFVFFFACFRLGEEALVSGQIIEIGGAEMMFVLPQEEGMP